MEQTHLDNACNTHFPTSGSTSVPRDSAAGSMINQRRLDVDPVSKATEKSTRVNGKSDNHLSFGSSDSSNSALEKLASVLQERFNLPNPELSTINGPRNNSIILWTIRGLQDYRIILGFGGL